MSDRAPDDRAPDDRAPGPSVSRSRFLKWTAGLAAGAALSQVLRLEPLHLEATEPIRITDPLTVFPNRDWERVYRDLFRPDSQFVFTCAPNDTHNCLLRASVKNGVVVRIHQTYGYGKAQDLYGNTASHRWDPRGCQKGLALARKFYGDRRVQAPMVRKGWKEWADAGFPRDPATGAPRTDLTKRGADEWVRVGWDEALELAAKAYVNVATTFSGAAGAELLRKQGYDPDMIAVMEEAGTRTLKVRGGMPLLGITRIFGFNRFINEMALLDDHIRKVGKDKAKGGRALDSFAWHTDLPPGQPMVTGHQSLEFELFSPEYADLVVTFGMNWISTKMPDGHWLAEARQKGTKIIVVSTDYQSTANRADEVILTRPGVDGALILGCVQYILANNLYDERNVKSFTDLPLLVRLDTRKLLSAADVFPNYRPADLRNYVRLMGPTDAAPRNFEQGVQQLPRQLREQWGDFVVWDSRTNQPAAVSRDDVGEQFERDPALTGEFDVRLANGQTVKAQPVFALIKKYLDDNFTPQQAAEITWAKQEAIESLAKQIAAARGRTLLANGMGPNHYFNNDLFGRAFFLLAAVTDNIGRIGGGLGSYSGNYRGSVFGGVGEYLTEDPFDQELDPTRPVRTHTYYKAESAHYYNYGDRPLRVGNKNFTGKTHMPSPTKLLHFGNSNSLLGNAKWHHDVVHNTLPKIDAIFIHEWWWTASCEYADIVFPVDSWAEFKHVDASASCTNPFLHIFPRTPLPRIHDTRSDIEVFEGISRKLTGLTGDQRFANHWKFVTENRTDVYLQRVFDASSTTRGYRVADLERLAQQGIPALMNYRTYPRQPGWEQRNESKPWYNRTGRMEFYRDEPEFLEHGENLPVHREPIDATYFEPNVILAKPHPLIQPHGPEQYGLDPRDLSTEVRQVRNVVKPWSELKVTKHPLNAKDPSFKFVFITPKYRHGAHTTPVDLDWISYLFGPFGDMYRHDRRSPWVGEGYLEINPVDARALGIEDGDYVWFDADPEDRPYRGWKPDDPDYEVSRGMARARFNNALQPGVTRMWFHMYVATRGSVRGQKTREDGLAKNPDTNYQAHFRHGSHQSGTRAWLKPTLQTDTLTRKANAGHVIGTGYEYDVHTVVGAPKESFIKIEKAEDGAIDGKGPWRPVVRGLRPNSESDVMKQYLAGGFYQA